MTVLSRGARVRRGGRRPGWVLLTALLVLAMGASSALVFTNRVELLKLAVILALWAAVAGAFVSVLYRRQSDADQSRVRDLKLVYDLQLDREISARREYELTVESQLRRELASELRAQAADDLAALRAELSALRTSLEILFDTDIQHRPALETVETEAPQAPPARAYSDWDRNSERNSDWVPSDRFMSMSRNDPRDRADETAIIDVPEEPLLPPRQQQAPPPPPPRERVRGQYEAPPEGRYRVSQEPPYVTPAPSPEPRFAPPPPPQPEPQPQDWRPAGAEGQWLPSGTPGTYWPGAEPTGAPGGEPPQRRRARHDDPEEPMESASTDPPPAPPYADPGRRARSRHSAEYRDYGVGNLGSVDGAPPAQQPPAPTDAPAAPAASLPPQMAPPPAPEFIPRHRGPDSPEHEVNGSADQTPSGGQSVADLLARLQVEPSGGGRRRRRDS